MNNEKLEKKKEESATSEYDERVVSITRCSKVVKGGRNFSFRALVAVGNRNGRVGLGVGKANEVADAIRKGTENAKKEMIGVPMSGSTITHAITSKYRSGKIMMRPASRGTGLIAGGAMRAVLDLAGIHDILAKSLGSSNPVNVAKATMKGIESLRNKDEILAKRGLKSLL
ncbi:MAG: 30S ribosomal protein S5 [Victivallales bacterium]|nr:30S ribosomal protein S5 [Victivallales bacterium]